VTTVNTRSPFVNGVSRLGRATIGLYNSYDQRSFREAHRRALARAGALALTFDQNLITFGFPFPEGPSSPREVADWVADTTSIGEDGRYLRELATSGRFQCFPMPGRGFPPQLGDVILTTSKPDHKKTTTLQEIVQILKDGRGVCLLFGLGPRGVPRAVHEITNRHLDISERGMSLETCTAMGAVSAVIAHGVKHSLY
jgi:hypothetical protein